MIYFDKTKLREGDIVHGRGQSTFSKLIRRLLGSWGSHDAGIVRDLLSRELMIGESVSPFAKLTSLSEYEKRVNEGTYEVRVYRVKVSTVADGKRAAACWIVDVLNTPYNWLGIVELLRGILFRGKILLKLCLRKASVKAAGWKWAHWCTQGWGEAWKRGTPLDPWHKTNPTPYTTEKRVEEGVMEDITNQVMIERPDRISPDVMAGILRQA
jgi:hypothetical protein